MLEVVVDALTVGLVGAQEVKFVAVFGEFADIVAVFAEVTGELFGESGDYFVDGIAT